MAYVSFGAIRELSGYVVRFVREPRFRYTVLLCWAALYPLVFGAGAIYNKDGLMIALWGGGLVAVLATLIWYRHKTAPQKTNRQGS